MMTRLNPEDDALRMRAQQLFGVAALSGSDVNGDNDPEGVATSGMAPPPGPRGSDEADDTGLQGASGSVPNGAAPQGNQGSSLQHLQSVSLDEVITDPGIKQEVVKETAKDEANVVQEAS